MDLCQANGCIFTKFIPATSVYIDTRYLVWNYPFLTLTVFWIFIISLLKHSLSSNSTWFNYNETLLMQKWETIMIIFCLLEGPILSLMSHTRIWLKLLAVSFMKILFIRTFLVPSKSLLPWLSTLASGLASTWYDQLNSKPLPHSHDRI